MSYNYKIGWSVFGWASIFDKTDWKENRNNCLDKITEAVNEAGFTIEKDGL